MQLASQSFIALIGSGLAQHQPHAHWFFHYLDSREEYTNSRALPRLHLDPLRGQNGSVLRVAGGLKLQSGATPPPPLYKQRKYSHGIARDRGLSLHHCRSHGSWRGDAHQDTDGAAGAARYGAPKAANSCSYAASRAVLLP